MNERITIPENTRVIINGDVIIFEPKTPKELEVSKWYVSDYATFLIVGQNEDDDGFRIVGFKNINAEWICNDGIFPTYNCKHADPKEVTRLLIGEAEKKYKGNSINAFEWDEPCISNNHTVKIKFDECYLKHNGVNYSLVEPNDGFILFDGSTGKWAEIIPEKKPLHCVRISDNKIFKEDDYLTHILGSGDESTPFMTKSECEQWVENNPLPLYTNTYGTEFFEGDENWYVDLDTLKPIKNTPLITTDQFSETPYTSEMFTERECHRYLDENWDELNK